MNGRKAKTAPPEPLWLRFAKAFWQGMMTPSPAMLAICLAAFLCTVAVGAWLLSPAAMAGQAGDYIPRSGKDGDAYATVNALRLAHHRRGADQLVVLGTSTLAQALGSETRLSETISAQSGRRWEVHLLTTPLQSPWDQLNLAEAVVAGRQPGDSPMIVAIGVGPLRMGWTRERLLKYEAEPRLGLRSTWVDQEMRDLGATPKPRTGCYVLDNPHFVLLNGSEALMRLAVHRAAPRVIDYFADSDQPEPVNERPRAVVLREFHSGAANASSFLALYQRMISRIAAEPNVRVVLIEEAMSPGLIRQGGIGGEFVQRSAMISELAARNHTKYWPIITGSALSDSDFYDDLHVMKGAPQEKVRQTFAHSFGAYLERTGGGQ